jgi:hypothetical protein
MKAMRLLGNCQLGSTGCQQIRGRGQITGLSTTPSGTRPVVARRQRAIRSVSADAVSLGLVLAPLPSLRSRRYADSTVWLNTR